IHYGHLRDLHSFPTRRSSDLASGKWMKKIRGVIHYFGRWANRVNGKLVRVPGDGWEAALKEYEAIATDLHAGRTPRVKGDELTRSEEHTSELQSRRDLVCRLL